MYTRAYLLTLLLGWRGGFQSRRPIRVREPAGAQYCVHIAALSIRGSTCRNKPQRQHHASPGHATCTGSTGEYHHADSFRSGDDPLKVPRATCCRAPQVAEADKYSFPLRKRAVHVYSEAQRVLDFRAVCEVRAAVWLL